MKECRMCKAVKPLFDFNKKCDTADGLTSRCKLCQSTTRKARYAERGDVIRLKNTAWYGKNKESVTLRRSQRYDSKLNAAKCKLYYEANREKVRAINTAWERANRDKVLASWRAYGKRKREVRNANAAKRRAIKRLQYPLWYRELTDLAAVEASSLARLRTKMFGFNWDVDHIVPLAGKTVSGFHVWNNLQVIPSRANRMKSNKHEGF
jgi:hypothetical protein